MIELFLFLILGIILGIIFGLIPGIHPNFIIVFVPLLSFITQDVQNLLVFIASLAVTNSVVDTIPSILLGAPEPGMELTVSPGHRLLMKGYGYQAIKLTAIGSLGAVLFVAFLLPLISFGFPLFYSFILPILFLVLLLFSGYMIVIQKDRRLLALIVFVLAGTLGLSFGRLPVDSSILLFPILSGFFGASTLIVQLRQKPTKIPKQKPSLLVSKKTTTQSIIGGSVGGIFSGALPGIGTSQLAALATTDKNEKSFLVTVGALTTSNILISILSLWLIGKARSGASIVIENFTTLNFNDVVSIIFVSLISVSIAIVVTLYLAKRTIRILEQINYNKISKIVLIFLTIMVFAFSGIIGLILFVVTASLGIYVISMGMNRSLLMAVLIVPTLLFYFPL